MKCNRCISWMIPAVPDQSATGRVAAALLMSFPQISLEPRAASNWSGETGKMKAHQFPTCSVLYLKHRCFLSLRHVSFVDCPGHDILMATMLNGAAVMDAALLLIGTCLSSEPLPSGQTPSQFIAECVIILSPFFSGQRAMSSASDIRASGCHRDHEAEAHPHPAE